MISTRYTGGFGDFPDVIHTCRAKNYSSLDRIAVKWVNLEGAENFLTPLYILKPFATEALNVCIIESLTS